MNKVVLFCKSYDDDMFRAKRLAESVKRFNSDDIPLYFSVPSKDLVAFQNAFRNVECHFLTDEAILEKTCHVYGAIPQSFPSHLRQQLIKLEFWRMGLCENYVWIDSDSYFLRHFHENDFFFDENTPYTIRHDTQELRQFSAKHDTIIIEDFERLAKKFQQLFNRSGPYYNFGYPPIIWSCLVMKSFYEDYIKSNNTTIFQILEKYPCEMQLYGEYLLYSKTIPIIPIDPMFKVFHYAEQFFESQMQGESETSLSKDFFGVIFQSNWARIDQKKTMSTMLSQFFRRLRRSTNPLIPW